jgi:hypothetical protein
LERVISNRSILDSLLVLIFHEQTRLFLLHLLYFSLGFGYYSIISVSLFALYVSLYLNKNDFIMCVTNVPLLFFLILSILYFGTTFFPGHVYMTLKSPFSTFMQCIFYVLTIFITIGSEKNSKVRVQLLFTFMSGLFFYSITVIAYSYLKNPVFYGYKFLFNPYANSSNSSTTFSNNVALTFIGGIVGIMHFKGALIRLLFLIMMILSLLSVFFVSGRTFIFVVVVFLFLFCLYQNTLKYKIYSMMLILFVIFSVYVLYSYILPESIIAKFDKSMINRLPSLWSENNPRYKLWKEGFLRIFEYPFGGYMPMSVHQYWFHNIWLDTARVGGLLPLGLFFSLNAFTAYFLVLHRRDIKNVSILLLAIASLMILGQDLVIESSNRIITLYFYLLLNFYFLCLEKKS